MSLPTAQSSFPDQFFRGFTDTRYALTLSSSGAPFGPAIYMSSDMRTAAFYASEQGGILRLALSGNLKRTLNVDATIGEQAIEVVEVLSSIALAMVNRHNRMSIERRLAASPVRSSLTPFAKILGVDIAPKPEPLPEVLDGVVAAIARNSQEVGNCSARAVYNAMAHAHVTMADDVTLTVGDGLAFINDEMARRRVWMIYGTLDASEMSGNKDAGVQYAVLEKSAVRIMDNIRLQDYWRSPDYASYQERQRRTP